MPRSKRPSPEAQVKASGIKAGDTVRYSDMTPTGYVEVTARVEDFWYKYDEATVNLDNGEWRYLREVRKVG